MKEVEDMAVEAREGAERVRKIVRGLKTFSRADEERRVVMDVKSALELAVNMAFNEMRHRARLVKDYGPVPLVDADEARLGQVFINLLINAAQTIPEGDVAANEIRIVTSTDTTGRAVVEVKDTGPGIPAAVLGRIFDPFFTTKPVGIGTGLGLSICHSIVTGMGGEIAVVSELGRGTTFRVTLPAAIGPAVSPVMSERRIRSARAVVLIVDDDPFVGAALARVLRDHEVVLTTKARDALDVLAGGKRFDVILSDLMMPEMSGMEFYDELTRRDPRTAERVIFLTGGAFTPDARAFLDRVPNRQIEKPFDPERLRALVQTLAR
jgi:CheY-like chemotaxis protein